MSEAMFKLRRATQLLAEAMPEASLDELLALLGAIAQQVVRRFGHPPATMPGTRVLWSCARLLASCQDAMRHGDPMPTMRLFDAQGRDITEGPASPRPQT